MRPASRSDMVTSQGSKPAICIAAAISLSPLLPSSLPGDNTAGSCLCICLFALAANITERQRLAKNSIRCNFTASFAARPPSHYMYRCDMQEAHAALYVHPKSMQQVGLDFRLRPPYDGHTRLVRRLQHGRLCPLGRPRYAPL